MMMTVRGFGLIGLLSLCLYKEPVDAIRNLQIVSPLQSLTIPDPEVKEEQTTRRQRFLERFRVGG